MNKIYEIVTAWAAFAQPSQKQTERAHIRYEECEKCEFNSGGTIEFCDKCNCPIQVKIFTLKTPEEGNCPENKWKI
jgi:hypothetical protein